jgi:mRNA interferase RelE/StbE
MVSIKISDGALKDLKKIDQSVSKRVVAKIIWLEQNFADVLPDRLHHELRGLYKLRVGDYRAIYSINNERVVVEAVQHRRDAYK